MSSLSGTWAIVRFGAESIRNVIADVIGCLLQNSVEYSSDVVPFDRDACALSPLPGQAF